MIAFVSFVFENLQFCKLPWKVKDVKTIDRIDPMVILKYEYALLFMIGYEVST